MNNCCKTYQQATLEMLWLGTQSRSIDVIHAVADQEEGPEGPAPPQLRPECRKKFFWRVRNSTKINIKYSHCYSKKKIDNNFPRYIILSTVQMTSKYSNFAVKLISCGLWFNLSFEHFDVSIIGTVLSICYPRHF